MTTPTAASSRDTSNFEYPDEAGYPDGSGTLNEGVDLDPDAAAEDTGLGDFLDADSRDE